MVSYHASPFENSFNVKTKSHVLYLLKKLIFSSTQAQAMDRPFLNPSKNKINPRHTVHNTAYCVLVIFFFHQLGQCSIACNLHQGQTIYSSHDSSGISPHFHYFLAPAPGNTQERFNQNDRGRRQTAGRSP